MLVSTITLNTANTGNAAITSDDFGTYGPDFRMHGKILATVGYPDESWGMVKLTPDQQHDSMRRLPRVSEPAAGSWAGQGSTTVPLDAVDETILLEALTLAWRQVQSKKAARS